MTENQTNSQSVTENKSQPSDKELNFRAQEAALKAKYETVLAQERAARMEAERIAMENANQKQKEIHPDDDDDDDDEPYVDKKKLKKKLDKFGKQTKQETQNEIKKAVEEALVKERQQNWIKSNSDFYDVMKYADKFAEQDPELAETILQMPDNFERQKLVYKNIKLLGLHKPPEPKSTIQEKIDRNQRGSYYQPSGIASPAYAQSADFSQQGQKQAYDKMQELKSRLRLG